MLFINFNLSCNKANHDFTDLNQYNFKWDVLENGKVVEQGNHQELLAKEGLYQKLINMQSFSN